MPCANKKGTDQPPSMHFTFNPTALCYMYICHIPLWIVKMHHLFYCLGQEKNMCVYYYMEKLNRVDRLENVFILLKKFCMGIIERKKFFRVGSKK